MSSYRFLSDADLLAQCSIEHYRGSGPGGQKRNKTSNAVRLKHLETGLIVTATEARSAKENHIHAMQRMKLKLACEVREAIDLVHFDPPDWFRELRRGVKINISPKHQHYFATGGLILDLLELLNGNPSDVAQLLGVNTSSIIRTLEKEPGLWTKANHIRRGLGLAALEHRNS